MFGLHSAQEHFLHNALNSTASSTTPEAGAPTAKPSLQDDGYHFPQFRSGATDEWYIEWWYFNFIDAATGHSGFVAYQVTNPSARLFPTGQAMLIVALFPGDGSEPIIHRDSMNLEKFSASTTRPDVQMGQSSIETLDPQRLRVVARVSDDVAVHLEFEQRSEPVWLAHGSTGPEAWEKAYWMAYMPVAKVTGHIQWQGKGSDISGTGYHDHNWGKWSWHLRKFLWVSCTDQASKLSFDLGDGEGFTPGYTAVLQFEGLKLEFPAAKTSPIEVHDTERYMLIWKFPSRLSTRLVDASDRYELLVEWKVSDTLMVTPIPLTLLEHRCRVHGKLTDRQSGETREFQCEGFCESTPGMM